MTILQLRELKAELVAKSRQICDVAIADGNRPMTAEERQNYDAACTDIDEVDKQIVEQEAAVVETSSRLERQEKMEADLKKPLPQKSPRDANRPLVRRVDEQAPDQKALAAAGLNNFILGGIPMMQPRERAALQADNDTTGGTLVVPEQFINDLIIFVNNAVHMRGISTVLPVITADSVGIPSVEADPADADWTSEILIGGEDSTMATGKRVLTPHPLGKLLRVSRKMLRQSAVPAENLIRERLGYKFAVSEEKAFLTGTGAAQPLGVFTASASGISTARDMSTGNTTTAVTADGLINNKYNLKAQYMASPSLRWFFNRTVLRDIRKLKDGNGQYLWIAGLAGAPDTILEVPYLMSEYAPNTMTTGLYVGILGDFRWYYIVEALKMELQRLDERYAETSQVGFIGRMELDGMPVLEEAFSRIQLS